MTRIRPLLALFVLSFVLVTSVLAWTYRPVVAAAPLTLSSAVLRMSDDSLTDYLPTSGSLGQDLCLADEHRGVGLNGVPTLPAPHELMMGANPLESASSCSSGRVLNGVDLVTGVFTDTQVYMSFPTIGSTWSVGATYSSAAECGSASDGYQGRNWAAFSAPEIVFEDTGADGADEDDFLYILYGADRYVEFQRDGSTAYFLGVNGAGGVVEHDNGNHEYIFRDIFGTEARFFDDDAGNTNAKGQLWKIISANERVCSVGSIPGSPTRANALAAFNSAGGPNVVFDGSGRRFTYDYTSGRLDSVVAEIDPNGDGNWADAEECGRVDFSYYGGSDDQGSAGDLGFVKVTTPVNDSHDLVTYTHYRYYQDGDDDGEEHELKMVVQAEGVRRYGLDNPSGYSATLAYYDAVADSALYSYASHRFEYNGSGQIVSAWFAGDCGCSGGSEGKYEISYGTSGTDTSGYDTAWRSRAVVKRPDETYLTQYFDEVGQALSTVITSHEPGTTPTPPAVMKTWVTRVERDASGHVYEVATPANASSYSHSTGVITPEANSGLVSLTTRIASPSVLEGFPSTTWWRDGDAGTTGGSGRVAEWVYGTQDVEAGTGGPDIVRPFVDEYRDFYDAGSGQYDATEFEYMWRSSTSLKVEAMRTTYPAVPTTEHGSGVALEELQYFDEDNQLTYSKAADGIISQFKYDAYGQVEETVEDVDYADAGSTEPLSLDGAWDFGQVGSGQFHRATTYTHDCVGRQLETTLPSGRVTKRYFSITDDDRVVSLSYPRYEAGGTPKYYGPIDFSVTNQAGKVEDSGRISLDNPATTTVVENDTTDAIANHVDESKGNATELFGLLTYDDVVRLRRSIYSDTGTKQFESHLYFDVPSTGLGAEGTNFDATLYHHDDMGRQIRVAEPSGTIYRTNYDVLGRPEEILVGTNDNGKDGGSPSGTANMVATEITEYDGGSAGGNSLVTSRTERTTATSTGERVTSFSYDERDRLVFVQSPTAPHSIFQYDYRGRRVATGAYSSLSGKTAGTDLPTASTSANRLALSETSYDMLGRVWKTTRHKIDASNGNSTATLNYETWFDAGGQMIKHRGQSLTKVEYDRLGRVFNEFDLASIDDGTDDNEYSKADDVEDDIVLEQREMRYDDEDNVILAATIYRHPNDRGASETTGVLDLDTGGDELELTAAHLKGRAHITAMWYDSLGRLRTSANYGTYGGSSFDRDGFTEPTSSGSSPTRLVTKMVYGGDGAVLEVTDENGIPNRTLRDDAGRVTAEIRNYADGVPVEAVPDVDVIVAYEYTNGLRVKYIADLDNTGTLSDQVTEYVYDAVTASGPDIYAGHLLRKVIYPDGDSFTDNVSYTYNVQGEQLTSTDQAGNVLERVYDASGRLLDLKATTIQTGSPHFFDNYVQMISRQYDSLGRTAFVTQFADTTKTTARDQVQFTYDGWGMREDFVQDVNGAIVASGDEYAVINLWETETGNDRRQAIRLDSQTYPSGTVIEPIYSSQLNLHDDEASRASGLKVDTSVKISYEYLGSGWVVETDYLDIDVERKLHGGATWPTAPTYDALDDLGRLIKDRWTQYTSNVTFFDVDVTYQSNQNIIASIEDHVNAGFDVNYTHDGVARLKSADEGESGGTWDSFRKQEWTLDPLGNWGWTGLDLNGDGDFTDAEDLNETREHNDVNEMEERDTDSSGGAADHTLVYDAVGNLTNDDESYKYKYDVFGRQVSVLNQSDVEISNYRYNGLGYLIQEEVVAESTWFKYVFDSSWRVLAKYSGTDLLQEYIYHRAGAGGMGGSSYIDLVAFRDRDTDDNGSLEERVWYCQDRLANVVVVLADEAGSASVLDFVGYSAYGVPFMTPPGDMDGDGVVTGSPSSGDLGVIAAHDASDTHHPKADINLDGDVDSADYVAIRGAYKDVQFGQTVLSSVDSQLGYRGYRAQEHSAKSWRVRHRTYGSSLGRWLSRDALEYHDGSSLYGFVGGMPNRFVDSLGLSAELPTGTGGVPPGVDNPTEENLILSLVLYNSDVTVRRQYEDGCKTCVEFVNTKMFAIQFWASAFDIDQFNRCLARKWLDNYNLIAEEMFQKCSVGIQRFPGHKPDDVLARAIITAGLLRAGDTELAVAAGWATLEEYYEYKRAEENVADNRNTCREGVRRDWILALADECMGEAWKWVDLGTFNSFSVARSGFCWDTCAGSGFGPKTFTIYKDEEDGREWWTGGCIGSRSEK